MNYKTYAEAKIANPDSEIVTTGKNCSGCNSVAGDFQKINDGVRCEIGDKYWVICNPADYCSSMKEFFDAGFNLVAGDKIIGVDKSVWDITADSEFNHPDEKDEEDGNRYILSASALNGGCKIPSKSEQWSIYSNKLPLCELTDERYGKMRRSHDAGMDVEWRESSISRWELLSTPTWNAYGVYRIKPKSERELFIDKSMEVFKENQHNKAEFMLGKIYDAGARYKDLTQHFGENI